MALDAHIQSLEQKHQQLEDRLAELTASPSSSSIDVAEVKRHKLQIKDEISRLRSEAA